MSSVQAKWLRVQYDGNELDSGSVPGSITGEQENSRETVGRRWDGLMWTGQESE